MSRWASNIYSLFGAHIGANINFPLTPDQRAPKPVSIVRMVRATIRMSSHGEK